MAHPRIAIIGAGIAGLTFALCLARKNIPSVIIEKAKKLEDIGAGLQISPNAGKVLENLGLTKQLNAISTMPKRIAIRSAQTGMTLNEVELGRKSEETFGSPYRVLHRQDLQSLLLNEISQIKDITLKLGTTIEGMIETPLGATLMMKGPQGKETLECDLLVGADGVHSWLRGHIRENSEPISAGYTAWRSTINLDPRGHAPFKDETNLWLAEDAHFVHYPIAKGQKLNLVAIFKAEEQDNQPDLQSAFEQWPVSIKRLIASAQEWTQWPLLLVSPEQIWIKRRMVLIGDAAHAMAPFLAQGAAMAIEDSAVLANSLAAENQQLDSALSTYEAMRKPRVTKVWEEALDNGKRYHMQGWKARLRDAALKFAPRRQIQNRYDWIYEWSA
jgi:salicylate hydroxylase